MGIGERIKFIRKSRNVTQISFSKELGISQAYVSKLEKGKENPSDLLLNFIAYRYCVNLNWLKTGAGDIENHKGIERTDCINSLHMYLYELEELYNDFTDDQVFKITNSVWYLTSIVKEINNCKNLDIINKDEFIKKIEEIYRNLWAINSIICNTYFHKHNEPDIYLKINNATIEIQRILTHLCTLSE